MRCARSNGKPDVVRVFEDFDAAAPVARRLPPDQALALAEAGTPPVVRFGSFSRLLPPPTAAALKAWANAVPISARACFAALYQGSGATAGGELVRLRYLSGPTGEHHGLRPIRVRLVAYLVAPNYVRTLASDIAATPAIARATSLALVPAVSFFSSCFPKMPIFTSVRFTSFPSTSLSAAAESRRDNGSVP